MGNADKVTSQHFEYIRKIFSSRDQINFNQEWYFENIKQLKEFYKLQDIQEEDDYE